jgi:hypothetical protein
VARVGDVDDSFNLRAVVGVSGVHQDTPVGPCGFSYQALKKEDADLGGTSI